MGLFAGLNKKLNLSGIEYSRWLKIYSIAMQDLQPFDLVIVF